LKGERRELRFAPLLFLYNWQSTVGDVTQIDKFLIGSDASRHIHGWTVVSTLGAQDFRSAKASHEKLYAGANYVLEWGNLVGCDGCGVRRSVFFDNFATAAFG
jgi:hypothetical protein